MLKKLYKHEFKSLFRLVLPIYAGLFIMAGLTRLLDLLPKKSAVIDFLATSTTVLYVLAILGMCALVTVIIVTRFYRHLLSKEGYLTFSLPVRAADHLNCKLVCSTVVLWLSVIAMCGSLVIVFLGTNALLDFYDGLRYLFEFSLDYFKAWQLAVLIIEGLVAVLAVTLYALLLFYCAICIGQQFKKRVGKAVLFGFVIYAAIQTLGVLIISVFSTVDFEKWIDQINFTSFGAICAFLGAVILWEGGIAAVLYGISRHLLTKKLNLQ